MRRIGAVAIFLVATSARAQFAPQTWPSDQDGANFICADVGYFQANNLTGSGTGFVCTDPTGKLVRSATACVASGAAFYQFVDDPSVGTQPQRGHLGFGESAATLCTNDDAGNDRTNAELCAVTGNPFNVGGSTSLVTKVSTNSYGQATLVQAVGLGPSLAQSGGNLINQSYEYVSRSTNAPVNAVNMGALASGVNEQTTSAGVATPLTYAAASGEVQYGAPSGGGLAQSADLTFVASTLDVNGPIDFGAHVTGQQASFTTVDNLANFTQMVAYPVGATNVGMNIDISPRGTGFSSTNKASIQVFNTDYVADPINFEVMIMRSIGAAGFAINSLASGTGTTRPIVLSAGANANQLLLNATGTVQFDLGELLSKAIVAPATPSAGYGAVYVDSTSKNICEKNDAGTVNHGVQTDTGTASQWIRAISDAGAVTKSQPAFTDVSGTETCGQSAGPYTGSVVKAANSCATKVIAIDESGGLNIPIGACTADGQAFVKVAGSMTCRLPTVDLANDYTAPWVIGMHDGASAQWTTSGTWAAGQILVTAASNHISTEATATCAQFPALTGDVTKASGSCATVVANVACSALPALTGQVTKTAGSCATVIAPGVLTTSLAYYVAAVNPILGGGFLETSSSVSTLSSSDIPYPLGVAATTGRLRINILANSIVTSLGTGVITFTVFSNGVNNFSTTALTTVAAGTQVDTGLNSALGTTAVTDGWSVKITSTGTYVSGSITFTAVLVMGY